MKRRVRFAGWLFNRSRIARAAFVFSVWPFVHVADRWQGVDPPASFRRGWQWVRDGEFDYDPMIRTSDTPATVRRVNARDEIDELAAEIIAAHIALYHPDRSCRENERGECIDRFGGTPGDHFYFEES